MDFIRAGKLGSLISREYAQEFFALLVKYRDISASQAASRLGLHIKTTQDFLEALLEEGIVSRREVSEGKRPYFRYSLERTKLSIDVDISSLHDREADGRLLGLRIRETRNSGAIFKSSGGDDRISSITFFSGSGRSRTSRKLNLTASQGRFIFHLPFPTQDHAPVAVIAEKSGIDESRMPEILDLVEILLENGIIDKA